jgi:hypothetical protein
MIAITCCESPQLSPESTDLGHADSFEFMLTSCTNCGVYWMNVFCVANAITGFEPVSAIDAIAMLAAKPGQSRKELMRNWAYHHT